MSNAAVQELELSSLLEELWVNKIIPLYEAGKIQTERHLQSYLFMLLKNRFTEQVHNDWDVWVEPQLYFKNEVPPDPKEKKYKEEKMYKPDLVITKGPIIEGFIEVKFTPQEGKWEKNCDAAYTDFEKLVIYSKGNSNFPQKDNPGNIFLLDLDPATGVYDNKKGTSAYKRVPERTKYFFLEIAWLKSYNLEEALLEKAGKERGIKERFRPLVYSTRRDKK